MARAFSRSVSNSWPVQNSGSKTWTGELHDSTTHKTMPIRSEHYAPLSMFVALNSELSVGPFLVTRPNPTHRKSKNMDPTQSNSTRYN